MKNYIFASAIVAAMSTPALADDFDNNTVTATVVTNASEFQLSFDDAGSVTDFETNFTAFAYDIGSVQTSVRTGFAYDLASDEISLIGQYTAMTYASDLTVYGTAEIEYRTTETDFSDGDFYANPSAGVDYAFAEIASVFAEVGYSWNINDSWEKQGGYVEVGMPVYTNYSVTITPSIVQGFDDGIEEANFNLDVTYTF